MRWRTIRGMILCLLLIINGIFFLILYNQEKAPMKLSEAQQKQVRQIFRQEGISWEAGEIPTGESARLLKLQSFDMEYIVYQFLGDNPEEINLYGSRVKYRQGEKNVILDRENSSAEYRRTGEMQERTAEEEARQLAEEFIGQFTGMDLSFELQQSRDAGDAWYFLFYQSLDGKLLTFNKMEVWVDAGVRRARFTYYLSEEQKLETEKEYPPDELMYQCLRMVQDQEIPVNSLQSIRLGYRLEKQGDEIRGLPCLFAFFDQGVVCSADRVIS